ncbi:MAG: cysteine--tRNA ligase [Planctomycetota bacterium]|nr:cysteine--tRNA ligase [Planctomycetota bacterium]
MTLRIYNTLTREKEDFAPVNPGKVGMYLCGPTVYKPAHIGHMVGPVIFDTIKKYLAYLSYDVTWIVNITDVDDKLINKANELGRDVSDLAREMTQDYFENLATMGVDSIDRFPYATEHIPEMLSMIATLIEKGHAYPLDGDVYFQAEHDDDYGKLSHRNINELVSGERVEAADRKKHPADFALWKASKPGEPSWESPWGPGRPGWHIECSAMSMKYLGETLDIHGGGLDLLFPHHENELAQSECCTGKTFSKYWLHNGLMQASGQAGKVGGQHDRHGDVPDMDAQVAGKLAGSAGAESVKTAVFSKHHPETVRFFLLATHYRSPIDFGDERIEEVDRSLEGFYRLIETFQRITGQDFYSLSTSATREQACSLEGEPSSFLSEVKALRDRYYECMDDDFNTGGAVGVLFDLRKTINGFVNEAKLDGAGKSDGQNMAAFVSAATVLKELAGILGVFRQPIQSGHGGASDELVEGLMQLVISLRGSLRGEKNWPLADRIRDSLNELKITLEDRPDGTLWRRD